MPPSLLPRELKPTLRALEAVIKVGPHEFTTRQLALLMIVARHHPKTHSTSSLADETTLAKPTITRSLTVLEKLGLITNRRSQDADRRRNVVRLTTQGELFLGEIAAATKAA